MPVENRLTFTIPIGYRKIRKGIGSVCPTCENRKLIVPADGKQVCSRAEDVHVGGDQWQRRAETDYPRHVGKYDVTATTGIGIDNRLAQRTDAQIRRGADYEIRRRKGRG